jgi:5-methyltetrahydrofolate--homocysteine methyltransferase
LGDKAAGEAAVAAYTEHFRGRSPTAGRPPRTELPLDQRLARAVVEGSKVGLEDDLAEALRDCGAGRRWPDPLALINGPLLAGMDEVGKLFNANQLIVAEVLQSAEVMKAAVNFLEPHMEKQEGNGRGKVLLATVKGDVHDIGKNLVDIILSNNGFQVVNLGIKVPSEQLVQAAREHRPDVIGLSGLLVKSAQQMVITAGDLAAAGVDTPLLVGGAALTRRFTHQRIAPAYGGFCTYAKDAMHGLELVDRILDKAKRPGLEAEVQRVRDEDLALAAEKAAACRSEELGVSNVRRDLVPLPPPDLERHVEVAPLREVWAQLNHQMLYSKYFGLKGTIKKLSEARDPKFLMVEGVVDELKALALEGALEVKVAWRFFPAEGEGNRLRLLDPARGSLVAEWELPRQPSGERLCLADYVLPGDHVALFVTTAGRGVRERAERWKEQGEYLKSHGWASLALESAEAAAEWLHMRLRAAWGFPDPPTMQPGDRFAARYQGRRYSFGYPACPDLAGQRQLFAALAPEEIGVHLTDGDMMDPEASVSALVFQHPDAKYFAV